MRVDINNENKIFSRHELSKTIQHSALFDFIVIVLVIIIIVVPFMPDIYNYIPETNRASRVYSVAAVLYLQFVLHVILFRP